MIAFQTVTVAYEGPKGPLLWSGTLRRSDPTAIQLESLLVDADLKEHNVFVSVSKTDNAAGLYFNTSSSSSEPLQVNLGYLQDLEDEGKLQVYAKILYPTDFLDVMLNLDDDENYGFTLNGHFKAPSKSKMHCANLICLGRGSSLIKMVQV